jgi:hypothetical protein
MYWISENKCILCIDEGIKDIRWGCAIYASGCITGEDQSPITSRLLDHKAAFQLSGRGKVSDFWGRIDSDSVTQSNGQATETKVQGRKKKKRLAVTISALSSSYQPARQRREDSPAACTGRTGLTSSHSALLPAVQMLQLLHIQSDSMAERVHSDRDRRGSGYLLVAFPALIMHNHALLSGSPFRVQTT